MTRKRRKTRTQLFPNLPNRLCHDCITPQCCLRHPRERWNSDFKLLFIRAARRVQGLRAIISRRRHCSPPFCFAPSVYIKCHSHSHAPSITPNSKRLRPPTRPTRRGSPSPRRVLSPPSQPRVFQNRRTFLPQKTRRYTTANHFIISNTLQPQNPLCDAFYYGNRRRSECRGDWETLASAYHLKRSLVAVWKSATGLFVGCARTKSISILFPAGGQLRLMFSAFRKSDWVGI